MLNECLPDILCGTISKAPTLPVRSGGLITFIIKHIPQIQPYYLIAPTSMFFDILFYSFTMMFGDQRYPVLCYQNKMGVKVVIFYFHD